MPIVYEENLKESQFTIIDTNGKTIANIHSNSVSEFNMVYNLFDDRIHGDISFMDYDNIINTIPLISEHKLRVYFQDKANFQSYQTFNIVHIGSTLLEGKSNIVKFALVDEYYFAFSRVNLPWSGNNCKIESAVNKFNSLLEPTIINKRKLIFNTTKTYDSLIVTSNHNFQQFLNYREVVDKINICKTKNKIIFSDIKNIQKECEDKSDLLVFKTEHPFSLNPLKIYDCDVSLLNKIDDVQDKANRSDFFYNPLNKSIKSNISNYSYKAMVQNVSNSSGGLPNAQDSIGATSFVRIMEGNKPQTIHSDINILSNYIVELTIKGSIQIDIGQIVGLQLMIPGTNTENKMLTGKWIVSRLSEKIIGMCYVQKLQLINAVVEYKAFKEQGN